MSEPQTVQGHLELLYPSEYVKAADLKGRDVTVVIDHLQWEQLTMAGGKRDRKVTLSMLDAKGAKRLGKRWVIGKTVLRQIAAALGGETDVGKWPGKSVTLFPTTCRGSTGSQVDCIRVRVKTDPRATEISEEMAAEPAPRPTFVDEAEVESK
jgi:hypothetical protein